MRAMLGVATSILETGSTEYSQGAQISEQEEVGVITLGDPGLSQDFL